MRGCCSLGSPSTKGPLANGVHPWQSPWRDPVEGMISLKHDTDSRPDLSCHISIYPSRVFFSPPPRLESQPKPTPPPRAALCRFAWTQTAFEGWPGCSRRVGSTSQLPNWHLGFGPCWDQYLFFFFFQPQPVLLKLLQMCRACIFHKAVFSLSLFLFFSPSLSLSVCLSHHPLLPFLWVTTLSDFYFLWVWCLSSASNQLWFVSVLPGDS